MDWKNCDLCLVCKSNYTFYDNQLSAIYLLLDSYVYQLRKYVFYVPRCGQDILANFGQSTKKTSTLSIQFV